jgi:hypothetical protein
MGLFNHSPAVDGTNIKRRLVLKKMGMFTNEFIKNGTTTASADDGKQAPFFKPAIQRQEEATPQQLNKPWSKELLTIIVYDDDYKGNCFGSATPGESSGLSTCMKWPSCRSFNIPLRVEFFVDRISSPHAQPFQPGPVSIDITFTPTGKPANVLYNSTDTKPVYKGPNLILEPSFGKVFPVNIDTDGQLNVTATLHDADSGQDVIYRDSARFVILCS